MKVRSVALPALLNKEISARVAWLLPALFTLARQGTVLSEVHVHYTRSLLKLARTGNLGKLLTILKYTACIVLLVNAGSLPFVWHIRVLWHLFAPRLRYWTLCLKLAFASKGRRARALSAWGESLSPVGANPFEVCIVYKRWASIDDIDVFGMHLSNSSYAKECPCFYFSLMLFIGLSEQAFDSARAKALVKCFPAWGRSGGHMALGATHYHFLREIPPLVKYEVRLSFGSWDHKWLYVVARYVTRPNRHATRLPQSGTQSASPSPIATPAENGSVDVERAVAAIIQTDHKKDEAGNKRGAAPIIEPDGAILHCVAVSQICFKWGRITIPPAVVLASDGFTKPYGECHNADRSSAGVNLFSHANPPPNWVESQALRVAPHGSMANFRDFLRGKWRDVPEGERWWEDALGGSVEAKRQANLEILESLRLGLERTRTLQ